MITDQSSETATPESNDANLTDSMNALHDWFMEFIQTRQSVFIPCLVVLGIALVLHVVVGWILRRYASRMNREGFQWTGVIASSLSAPAGWVIWITWTGYLDTR